MRLILILSLFISSVAHGQVYKFRAFESMIVHNDKNGDFVSADPWGTCNILIVINIDKSKLQIYSEQHQDFDMVKDLSHYKDASNNSWTKFSAVDAEGINCILRYIFFENSNSEHVATVYVEYANFIIVYRLKKD